MVVVVSVLCSTIDSCDRCSTGLQNPWKSPDGPRGGGGRWTLPKSSMPGDVIRQAQAPPMHLANSNCRTEEVGEGLLPNPGFYLIYLLSSFHLCLSLKTATLPPPPPPRNQVRFFYAPAPTPPSRLLLPVHYIVMAVVFLLTFSTVFKIVI